MLCLALLGTGVSLKECREGGMVRKAGISLGLCLLSFGTAAQAEWRRFETAHFVIYSESNDKQVTELATGLESIDGLMRMATGLPADVEPVKVRIYEMADEGAVEVAIGEVNSGVAGFYNSNILGPFAVTLRKSYGASDGKFTRELVLHHEYAHHFMFQYFPATYPGWYVEGFAELVGSSKILPDGKVAYGWPAKHRGDAIAYEWVPVTEVLLKPPEKLRMDRYGQGWALTHYLTFAKGRSQQLRQYLAMLTVGKSPQEAASAFGDLDQLNREAHAYVSRGQFDYRPVEVPTRKPVIQRVEAVSPAEAALIPDTIAFNDDDLALYRKASNREKERRRRARVLAHIQSQAARFPSDPYALYLLAEAENASGNSSAAEAAVDRLLAVQPRNVRGMVRKSLLLSQSAAKLSGAARQQKATQARQMAMAANQADPNEPLAFVAFYQSYRGAGAPVPRNALEGLEAAVATLPGNTGIRQMLVDEYAAQRRWADAIQALAPIANETHESPLRQAARERMAQLRAELEKDKAARAS
jgi:tetratricopeptide (TPR) repeat protein